MMGGHYELPPGGAGPLRAPQYRHPVRDRGRVHRPERGEGQGEQKRAHKRAQQSVSDHDQGRLARANLEALRRQGAGRGDGKDDGDGG